MTGSPVCTPSPPLQGSGSPEQQVTCLASDTQDRGCAWAQVERRHRAKAEEARAAGPHRAPSTTPIPHGQEPACGCL